MIGTAFIRLDTGSVGLCEQDNEFWGVQERKNSGAVIRITNKFDRMLHLVCLTATLRMEFWEAVLLVSLPKATFWIVTATAGFSTRTPLEEVTES
jgi:hypothetical protein